MFKFFELYQEFSHFTLYQHHLEDLIEHRLLGPILGVSDSVDLC